MADALLKKYDVPGPRYTSYPTVPAWDTSSYAEERWRSLLVRAFAESNAEQGLSLYVHLPFCESLCTFCGCTKRITRNHSVESPYVDALLREWSLYRSLLPAAPRLTELHLGGGTPTFFAAENLHRLVSVLIDPTSPADRVEFSFEAHPNSTTPEHLETLRGLGFTRVSLGVQDFDPHVQALINRIQPFERVAEVTRTAREVGYTSVGFDLVYGLPGQRASGVVDTMEKVIRLLPDRIAFYSYAHVPWVRGVGQRRFDESDLPRAAEKRALYDAGRGLLEQAGYREIGLDHFALPHDALYQAAEARTLHRNFMGYTSAHTLLSIGLGMSAISDAWYGFAQNEKQVEAYKERVARGELPVARGHILSAEDLLLRRHILSLMCAMETSWDSREELPEVLSKALERLAEMAADGLVAIDAGRLRVSEAGRPFLRNVCMALDAHLWRSDPATRLFSRTI